MFVIRKMPGVTACTIGECTYNVSSTCRAIAITIGVGKQPQCDTFFNSLTRGGLMENAGVGACRISACRHNREFECGAADIKVGDINSQGTCLTFVGL
jgi:hypothetical protein